MELVQQGEGAAPIAAHQADLPSEHEGELKAAVDAARKAHQKALVERDGAKAELERLGRRHRELNDDVHKRGLAMTIDDIKVGMSQEQQDAARAEVQAGLRLGLAELAEQGQSLGQSQGTVVQ